MSLRMLMLTIASRKIFLQCSLLTSNILSIYSYGFKKKKVSFLPPCLGECKEKPTATWNTNENENTLMTHMLCQKWCYKILLWFPPCPPGPLIADRPLHNSRSRESKVTVLAHGRWPQVTPISPGFDRGGHGLAFHLAACLFFQGGGLHEHSTHTPVSCIWWLTQRAVPSYLFAFHAVPWVKRCEVRMNNSRVA